MRIPEYRENHFHCSMNLCKNPPYSCSSRSQMRLIGATRCFGWYSLFCRFELLFKTSSRLKSRFIGLWVCSCPTKGFFQCLSSTTNAVESLWSSRIYSLWQRDIFFRTLLSLRNLSRKGVRVASGLQTGSARRLLSNRGGDRTLISSAGGWRESLMSGGGGALDCSATLVLEFGWTKSKKLVLLPSLKVVFSEGFQFCREVPHRTSLTGIWGKCRTKAMGMKSMLRHFSPLSWYSWHIKQANRYFISSLCISYSLCLFMNSQKVSRVAFPILLERSSIPQVIISMISEVLQSSPSSTPPSSMSPRIINYLTLSCSAVQAQVVQMSSSRVLLTAQLYSLPATTESLDKRSLAALESNCGLIMLRNPKQDSRFEGIPSS